MNENRHDPTRDRNIGIIAHIDAGKTTLTERILYYTGANYRIGDVDHGDTVTDWMEQERERGITITSTAITCSWKEHRITILDTPGHVDFTAEVERCLRVLDGAIVIFCAVGGVEPQSETVWHQADRFHVPRIAFINKMDRIGADFGRILNMMRKRLGTVPLPVQIPWGSEAEFRGVVDLIEGKLLTWKGNRGEVIEEQNIPEELTSSCQETRLMLLEGLADQDEEFMRLYLGEGESEPGPESIHAAIRRCVLRTKAIPVFCGAALKDMGAQPVLDGVLRYLPSPADILTVPAMKKKTEEWVSWECGEHAPLGALAFKVVVGGEKKRITYARIYSGSLVSGTPILNTTRDVKERPTKILRMQADRVLSEEKTATAGEIVALLGLQKTVTGDTLCGRGQQILFETLHFVEPVLSVAIEPRYARDQAKMEEILERIADEDPTLRVSVNEETGQKILSGMGELHLEIWLRRLLDDFSLDLRSGQPQVEYREAITEEAQQKSDFRKTIANVEHRASVHVVLSPRDRGSGVLVQGLSRIRGPAARFTRELEDALRGALDNGPLAAYPVTDISVHVISADCADTDLAGAALSSASTQACVEALRKAQPVLLEPFMEVDVVTPEEFMGEVIHNIHSRRGNVKRMVDTKGTQRVIRAEAPLAALFGYATELRSLTQGRATHSMRVSHYGPAEVDWL